GRCQGVPARALRSRRGGVWAPGGPRGLQHRRGRAPRSGGFDSRPPPPTRLEGTTEMSRVYVSHIQSDYGRPQHGNFEAVIAQDGGLYHWFRDNSSNDFGPWVRGPRITSDSDRVAGPGCLIQSSYGSGPHGNFEVIVPLRQHSGTVEL